MSNIDRSRFKYTWEEAIEILRNDPAHQDLVFNSYLTRDLIGNTRRFAAGAEFAAALALIRHHAPGAHRLLDMPGGNGIATHAFSAAGFQVTSVEPNPSASVGRGAIAQVLAASALQADIVDAWGENLPLESDHFDVAYVRQGLHHAADLPRMLSEIARVLKPGGVLLACREHVVDDYGASLEVFLASQVDHQLYGGEHAFTLPSYRAAILAGGLDLTRELGPFDSIINAYPNTPDVLRAKILGSPAGRVLRHLLPDDAVVSIGQWRLKRKRTPGRLYTFLAIKPRAPRGC
jgi:SAM-dependent methyltransferase